jgi:hypothetical protein
MKCECVKTQHFDSLNWVDTVKKTVPCYVAATPWGKANPVGITGGITPQGVVLPGYKVPYEILSPQDKAQIREQCAQQAKQKTKEICK